MTSSRMQDLLLVLGLTQSFSRPRVSDDYAYSESHFKTLKYHRFFKPWYESIEDAQETVGKFMRWYNEIHRHSGLGFLTPKQVHLDQKQEVLSKRVFFYEKSFRLLFPPQATGLVILGSVTWLKLSRA